jgi:hypothetical protein
MKTVVFRNMENEKVAVMNSPTLYNDAMLFLSIITNIRIDVLINQCTILSNLSRNICKKQDDFIAGHYTIFCQGKKVSVSHDNLILFRDKIPFEIDSKVISQFTFSLALRDRRCVVTGNTDPEQLLGVHVIPLLWKQHKYIGLPIMIKHRINLDYAEMGVNDIRNGLLMTKTLYTSFYNQHWSVIKDYKGFRIVAITKECPSDIIGTYLLEPDDGVGYDDMFVDPLLLEYHLESAVSRRIKGSI